MPKYSALLARKCLWWKLHCAPAHIPCIFSIKYSGQHLLICTLPAQKSTDKLGRKSPEDRNKGSSESLKAKQLNTLPQLMQEWDGWSETTSAAARDGTSAVTRSRILTSKTSWTGLKRLTEGAVPSLLPSTTRALQTQPWKLQNPPKMHKLTETGISCRL